MGKGILEKTAKGVFILLPVFLSAVFLFSSNVKAAEDKGDWKPVIFGQSIDPEKNSISIDANTKSVTLVAGDKTGKTGGGKVASSHDGISYYYTEVDSSKNFVVSAKVKVNFFAKETPDNQEAFGLMARDVINKNLDASVFPSNMVMIGGYRGAIQSVMRNYVKDISGAGAKMEDVQRFDSRPENDGSKTYLLKMRKTNTGYHVSIDNGTEYIYYRPKLNEVLEPKKVYVGFFAARVASITVTDIQFSTSDVATDPKGEPEPVKAQPSQILMISPTGTPNEEYTFRVLINNPGQIDLKLNGKSKFFGKFKTPGVFERTYTLENGDNAFTLQFNSDTGDEALLEKTVYFKRFGADGGIIYVSPMGIESGSGTKKDPLDLNTAAKYVRPGQTILLAEGKYDIYSRITIEPGNDGLKGNPKIITAEKGKRAILNFGDRVEGLTLWGSYWKLSGFDITGAKGNGLKIIGNNNVIERVNTYSNGDTGMMVGGFSTGYDVGKTIFPGINPKDLWPQDNLILNCISHDNVDISENNADGFAAKLTCRGGNIFRGCISYNNCDDGWDLYSKLETGPIGAVVIENCVSFNNGILSNGRVTQGDGNGFKLGGEGLAVKHVLRNCLSFNNRSMGITNNSDPAVIVENNTSVDNKLANFGFALYSKAEPTFVTKNNISFRTKPGPDDLIVDSARGTDNYFISMKKPVNAEGKTITNADFLSTEAIKILLDNDGKFINEKFMILAPSSSVKGGAKINDFSKITLIP